MEQTGRPTAAWAHGRMCGTSTHPSHAGCCGVAVTLSQNPTSSGPGTYTGLFEPGNGSHAVLCSPPTPTERSHVNLHSSWAPPAPREKPCTRFRVAQWDWHSGTHTLTHACTHDSCTMRHLHTALAPNENLQLPRTVRRPLAPPGSAAWLGWYHKLLLYALGGEYMPTGTTCVQDSRVQGRG
jgi:hypothetical protein